MQHRNLTRPQEKKCRCEKPSKPGASGQSGDVLCFPFLSTPSPSKVQLPLLHFNKKGGSDRAPPLPGRIPPSCSAGCIMSTIPALRRQQDSCASESRSSTVSSRPLKLYRFLVSQTTDLCTPPLFTHYPSCKETRVSLPRQ